MGFSHDYVSLVWQRQEVNCDQTPNVDFVFAWVFLEFLNHWLPKIDAVWHTRICEGIFQQCKTFDAGSPGKPTFLANGIHIPGGWLDLASRESIRVSLEIWSKLFWFSQDLYPKFEPCNIASLYCQPFLVTHKFCETIAIYFDLNRSWKRMKKVRVGGSQKTLGTKWVTNLC